jgi:uncharacterized protein
MTKVLTVTCPQCKGKSIYGPSNAYRPFCSERCRQIDLGAWASDQYVVAGSKGLDADLMSEDEDNGGPSLQ